MKIASKFVLSYVVFALCLGLITYYEQQNTSRISDTFKSLEANTTPALTSLLEALTATRRASVKAIEYATRGNPEDEVKAREALHQLKTALAHHEQIHHQQEPEIIRQINQLQSDFQLGITQYLSFAKGPPVKQVFKEEEKLQIDRSQLIRTVNRTLEQASPKQRYDLQVIKSEARKVSIKLIEFTLRGLQADRDKAKQAIDILQKTLESFSVSALLTPELVPEVSTAVMEYLKTSRQFLALISTRQQPVESIYRKEAILQTYRKALVNAIYPLVSKQYQQLGSVAQQTSSQLQQASRIQLYATLLILLLAFIAGMILVRLITSPLNKLNRAATQIAQGNLDIEVGINGRDEIGQLARRFSQMASSLKQQRTQLQQEIEKLQKTEQKLEHAQHIAQLGSWEFDIINNIVHWSDETYRIFGLDKSHDIASFEAYLNVIHPEDRATLQRTFELSLKNRTPYEIEHRLLLADGSIKYLYGKGETQYDENANPLRTLGTVQDITAQKKSEATAQRMKRMFEHSVEEIYIFDGHTLKFLQVSQGALQNLGYSLQQIESLTPADIKPDFTLDDFVHLIAPLSSGEKNQLIFETRHQRKDGSLYPVEVRLQYIHGDSFPAYLAIIIDLTERKKTQLELDRHRNHLESLVEQRTFQIKQQARIIEQTHDAVITVDMEGNITSWNKGAERLFHYKASAMLGQPISSLYPEDCHDFLRDEVVKPARDKGNHEIEVQLLRADGSTFPAHLSLSMLHDEQGEPVGMVGYSIDLSEAKQREQQLNELSRKLQQSNKELEAFSYSVSHDLRSPLRSIDGFSLAIVEDYGDLLDDTGKDYLQRVRNAAQRMGLLIDELLELSRVNRAELDLQLLSLNEIAQQRFDELAENHPERKVELIMQDNMQFTGAPRLSAIMIQNLMENAWKFTIRQEKAQITIKSLPDNPEVFYIKDNGVGFDMRHADKLFGAFQRLHQATEFPGTGVGLATVQRIINRHGGRIWADSKPGEGATFFFTLNPEQ